MAGPAFTIGVCREKQRLTDALHEAARDIVEIHNHEMADLVADGTGLPRSDLALARARQKHDRVKEALRRHVQAHGCG